MESAVFMFVASFGISTHSNKRTSAGCSELPSAGFHPWLSCNPTRCFSFGVRSKPVADLPGGWSLVAARSLLQAGVRRASRRGQRQAPGPSVPAGEPRCGLSLSLQVQAWVPRGRERGGQA